MNSSTGETPAHNYSRVDELLQAREARVLAWSLVARLIAFSIVTVFSLLQLLGVVRGIVADTDADAVIVLFLSMACGAAVVYGLVLARRGEQLRRVGLGAVFLDLAFMASLPFIWLQTTPTYASLGFLMKGELFTLASTMLVVNTLTLTPLYPALIAAGSILIHVAIIVIVTLDPRVVFVSGYMEHFSTPAVNPGVFNLRILILALEGAFLWLLAKTARRTIRDAVELEVSNFEIKERQAELLMEGKMAAMSALVAGVAHEVNTPLGVVRSNLDTSEAATSKLAEAVPSGNAAIERIVQVMKENGRVARQAVARIAKVVGSLKDFARLDQAELQRTDIREGLDTALALIEPNKKAGIEVVKEYSDVPEILCRPKELNQVFMTVLVNAFEAMAGEGTLRVFTSLSDSQILVKIADTGSGISSDQLEGLFEIGFGASKGRISMALGLPLGRRIVERHGGTLSVESELGKGAVFTISLPTDAKQA